jgi:DNA-binding transcriptional LysR family regulator
MSAKRRYFKELRISQLRAIVELARGKGFTAAAQTLGLTPPSVWQQIRGLEAEFGMPLVEVQGQQVHLTEAAWLLVELAEPVVHGFDAIGEQFSRQARLLPRRLRVAAPGNVLVNELPDPIRRYRQQHPDVELSLIESSSRRCRQMLEAGDADLAVVGVLDAELPSALAADHVTRFPFTLVCPEGHPLLRKRQITPSGIAQFPLVMLSQGTNSRERFDEVFAAAGLQDHLRISFETSTKELLLDYVRMEFGIAVVPISPRYLAGDQAVQGRTDRLAFRDVSRRFGHESIVILRCRHRREPPHHQAFRETVLQDLLAPGDLPQASEEPRS